MKQGNASLMHPQCPGQSTSPLPHVEQIPLFERRPYARINEHTCKIEPSTDEQMHILVYAIIHKSQTINERINITRKGNGRC